jgi:phage portal protein BeeE
LLRADAWPSESGSPVSPYIAENLSSVFGAIQAIAETVATLPLCVYRKDGDGKFPVSNHPVALLFSREPNSLQTPVEFLEMRWRIACCAETVTQKLSATIVAHPPN